MHKKWFVTGSLLAALAVILGAFAAHGLGEKVDAGILTPRQLEGFKTGASYQMIHALALIVCALVFGKAEGKLLKLAAGFFIAGIICFSGSLYVLTTAPVTGIDLGKWFGLVTPLGGVGFIGGWVALAVAGWKAKTS